MRYFCGCSPTHGQSCSACDGTDAEHWETNAHREAREAREVAPPDLLDLLGADRCAS